MEARQKLFTDVAGAKTAVALARRRVGNESGIRFTVAVAVPEAGEAPPAGCHDGSESLGAKLLAQIAAGKRTPAASSVEIDA